MSLIWRVGRNFKHWGTRETFLSTIMVRFALGGLCRWRAKVVLHHTKMVIFTLATQLGRYMVFFWNFTYCKIINTYWVDVVEFLWWHFYCSIGFLSSQCEMHTCNYCDASLSQCEVLGVNKMQLSHPSFHATSFDLTKSTYSYHGPN